MPSELLTLWRHRDFVKATVRREFELRYRTTSLGAVWAIAQPLVMVVVYSVVFSNLMPAKLGVASTGFDYALHVCAGILAWTFFSEIGQRMANLFLDNANLLKKIQFPRACLPIGAVLTAGIGSGVLLMLVLVFAAIVHGGLGFLTVAKFFWLPSLIATLALFAVGLGLVVGVLNVLVRDVGQMFSVAMTLWFWATPIVYPLSALPQWAQSIVSLNPLTPVVQGFQSIFSGQQIAPAFDAILAVAGLSLVLLAAGVKLFSALESQVLDNL